MNINNIIQLLKYPLVRMYLPYIISAIIGILPAWFLISYLMIEFYKGVFSFICKFHIWLYPVTFVVLANLVIDGKMDLTRETVFGMSLIPTIAWCFWDESRRMCDKKPIGLLAICAFPFLMIFKLIKQLLKMLSAKQEQSTDKSEKDEPYAECPRHEYIQRDAIFDIENSNIADAEFKTL